MTNDEWIAVDSFKLFLCAAFERAKNLVCVVMCCTCESGGGRAAVQTLREVRCVWQARQRLECGGFSTALADGLCPVNSSGDIAENPKCAMLCA